MNPFGSVRFRASPWIGSPFAGLSAPAATLLYSGQVEFFDDDSGCWGFGLGSGQLIPTVYDGVQLIVLAVGDGLGCAFGEVTVRLAGFIEFPQIPPGAGIDVYFEDFGSNPITCSWNPALTRYVGNGGAAISDYASITKANLFVGVQIYEQGDGP